jgi:uncharacterized protein YegP (UPF0339 family)
MLQRIGVAPGAVLIFWLIGSGEARLGPGPLAAAQPAGSKLTFEIYQDTAKEYRWRLKGTDDKLLATAGQGYSAKAECRKSVDRMMHDLDKRKFEVYEDKSKEFRWRLKASNGQIVAASSHAYPTKGDCEKAIGAIKKSAPNAQVSEEKAKDK